MKPTMLTAAEIRPLNGSRRGLYPLIWTFLALQALLLSTASPAFATFPGRNGLIAFQSQTDAGFQIFTVRPNGHDLRQITHVNGDAVAADWSPDGRQIVFEIDPPPDPSSCGAGIAIMNADGSNIVELSSDHTVCDFDPSFTPDGSRIVFDRFDPAAGDEAFWSMDRSGGDRKRIGNCCADPNVSPNGKKISFLCCPNGNPDATALFTSNIDGSSLFQVTPFSFDVAVKQDWAPDGKHLVFTIYGDVTIPGVSKNIAIIRPDGTHLHFVTHYEGGDVNATVGSYSPDGRWIVFRLNDHGSFGLFKIHPDGTHLTAILPLSSFRPGFIDWGARPSEMEGEEDDN